MERVKSSRCPEGALLVVDGCKTVAVTGSTALAIAGDEEGWRRGSAWRGAAGAPALVRLGAEKEEDAGSALVGVVGWSRERLREAAVMVASSSWSSSSAGDRASRMGSSPTAPWAAEAGSEEALLGVEEAEVAERTS